MALMHHPDKNGGDDTMFKQIKEAYEVLSNKEKRRQYDSVDGVDDKIPADKLYKESDFYAIFGACFKKNAKWSNVKPVPELGDEKSKDEDVIKFYSFWKNFQSWREFPSEGLYDLEEATNREERRWMTRENEKITLKLKKEEKQRINRLVQLAEKRDPRVANIKQREQERKRKEEKEKKEKKEKERREKEIQREKEERERAEREKLEKERKDKENYERTQFVTIITSYFDTKGLDDRFYCAMKNVLVNSTFEELKELSKLEEKQLVSEMNNRMKQYLEKKEEMDKSNEFRPFTKEEIVAFKHGCEKYPNGTPNRWRRIADYVKTRNENEVTRFAKEIKSRMHNERAIDSLNVMSWTKEQQLQLQNAILKFKDYKGKDKWDLIVNEVTDKDKQQCIDRVKYLREIALKRNAK